MIKCFLSTEQCILVCSVVVLFFLSCLVHAEECVLQTHTLAPRGEITNFSGHFSASFEHSGFNACGSGSSEQWWVHAPNHFTLFMKELEKLGGSKYETPKTSLFIKGRGCLSPAGTYGHMGAYRRLLEVQEVTEYRPETETDCDM